MYPLLAEQLIPNDATRPDSWREQFFVGFPIVVYLDLRYEYRLR